MLNPHFKKYVRGIQHIQLHISKSHQLLDCMTAELKYLNIFTSQETPFCCIEHINTFLF